MGKNYNGKGNNKGNGPRRANGQPQKNRESYLEQQIKKGGEDFMQRDAFRVKNESSKILRDLVRNNCNVNQLYNYLISNPLVVSAMITYTEEQWQESYVIWSSISTTINMLAANYQQISPLQSSLLVKFDGKTKCYNIVCNNLKAFRDTQDINYLFTIAADPQRLNRFY